MKICPVGAEMFYVDRQNDRHDEANSWFFPFCECTYKAGHVTQDLTAECCKKSWRINNKLVWTFDIAYKH